MPAAMRSGFRNGRCTFAGNEAGRAGPGPQGFLAFGSGFPLGALCSPGRRYSARNTSAGFSRVVARPGQNATALAMAITAGTMNSTGQTGVTATGAMPRPLAKSVQLHRPAATPKRTPASRATPVRLLICQAVM